jgi:hypothetical protein
MIVAGGGRMACHRYQAKAKLPLERLAHPAFYWPVSFPVRFNGFETDLFQGSREINLEKGDLLTNLWYFEHILPSNFIEIQPFQGDRLFSFS